MWVLKPRRDAASESMRPSWPPPRMPMVAPRGRASAIFAGCRGDLGGLLGAIAGQGGVQLLVVEREDRGSEERGVGGAGLADGKSADGDAGGHLDDREQAVLATQRLG